jgi:peptidoglycan/xylan/chitin deacetylase (PgdA/CDA1 family)
MRDPLVLCYHAVSKRWDADLSITPERLEHHLNTLVRRGYRGVTFSEAATGGPDSKVVAVTFDDGYRSVLTQAFPIMQELGLVGSVFVVSESLAYPYGDCDERVVAAAGRAGYRVAAALSSRLGSPRPLEWPRVGIYYGDDERRFRVKVSPVVRRLRTTAAFGAADRLRKALRR